MTKNMTPGESVYGEKRVAVEAPLANKEENGDAPATTKTEYRVWNPFRSVRKTLPLCILMAIMLAKLTRFFLFRKSPLPLWEVSTISSCGRAPKCCIWELPRARQCLMWPILLAPRAPCTRSSSATAVDAT